MVLFAPGQKFEDFLNDYYLVGSKGYLQYMGYAAENGPAEYDEFKKILTHDETNWYENAYAAEVEYQSYFNSELRKLFPKVPITSALDSFKYTTAHGLLTAGIGPGGATALLGSPTEASVSEINKITSSIMKVTLARDLHSMLHEKIPYVNRESNWSWMVNELAPNAFYDYIDKFLGGYETASNVHGVDTPATTHIECIDRMVSDGTESGDGTDHVSAVTDGDIIWDGVGSGSAKIDRSEAGYAFSDAQVKLPDTAGTEQNYQILEEIDDLMAVAKKYGRPHNYIGITTGKTLNKIQDEISPGRRILETEINVSIGLNGVNTRPGVNAGTPVRAIVTNGETVPMFTSEALPTKNSVYTTATSGHLYIIDLNHMYIRTDMPTTYLETGFGVEMLHQDYARSIAMLFNVEQLVCKQFRPHMALKWIKD